MSNIDDKFDFPCGKPGVSGLIDAMNSHMESSGRSDAVTMLWIGYLNALQEWGMLHHLESERSPEFNTIYWELRSHLPDIGYLESNDMFAGEQRPAEEKNEMIELMAKERLRYPERNRRNLKGTPSLGD